MSNDSRITEVTSSQREVGSARRLSIFKTSQWIWLLLGLLELLIALRIGLLMIGANPGSPIVALIYGLSSLFLFPFTGIVGSLASGNMVLELSSFFAMFIYALLAWGIERIVMLVFYRPRGNIVNTTESSTTERHNGG